MPRDVLPPVHNTVACTEGVSNEHSRSDRIFEGQNCSLDTGGRVCSGQSTIGGISMSGIDKAGAHSLALSPIQILWTELLDAVEACKHLLQWGWPLPEGATCLAPFADTLCHTHSNVCFCQQLLSRSEGEVMLLRVLPVRCVPVHRVHQGMCVWLHP